MIHVWGEWMAFKTPATMHQTVDTAGSLDHVARGTVFYKCVRSISTLGTQALSFAYSLEGDTLTHDALGTKC